MIFFTGIHNLTHASKVDYSFISINRLIKRKKDFGIRTWIMDSGAFSQVLTEGEHSLTAKEYADQIKRWSRCGILVRAVAQDYICIDSILEKLGRTVEEHQEMTIRNYVDLIQETKDCDVPIMPVLQGYEPEEYTTHVQDYGSLLKANAWVGIGSIARNASPITIDTKVRHAVHASHLRRAVRPKPAKGAVVAVCLGPIRCTAVWNAVTITFSSLVRLAMKTSYSRGAIFSCVICVAC